MGIASYFWLQSQGYKNMNAKRKIWLETTNDNDLLILINRHFPEKNVVELENIKVTRVDEIKEAFVLDKNKLPTAT